MNQVNRSRTFFVVIIVALCSYLSVLSKSDQGTVEDAAWYDIQDLDHVSRRKIKAIIKDKADEHDVLLDKKQVADMTDRLHARARKPERSPEVSFSVGFPFGGISVGRDPYYYDSYYYPGPWGGRYWGRGSGWRHRHRWWW